MQKDLRIDLTNQKITKSYSAFINHIQPPQKMFSKAEKSAIRCFYNKLILIPNSLRSSEKLYTEFNAIVCNIDFINASIRFWMKYLKKHHITIENKKQFPNENNKDYLIRLITNIHSYESRTKIEDYLLTQRDIPTIGFGNDPITKLPRVFRSEVNIDQQTQASTVIDKHILYAAGHSFKEDLNEQ